MLADEVTHVKMGSDWLRRLTANDPERQKQALEFQRTVDKLFSFGGFRGEQDENPVHLARKFRRLAGFTEEEITDLVDVAAEAYAEAAARQEAALAAAADDRPPSPVAVGTASSLDVHVGWAWVVIIGNGAGRRCGRWRADWLAIAADPRPVVVHRARRAGDLRAGRPRRRPGRRAEASRPRSSTCSTASSPSSPSASSTRYRQQLRHRLYLLYGVRRPVPDGPRHPGRCSSARPLTRALQVDDRAGEGAGDAVDHLHLGSRPSCRARPLVRPRPGRSRRRAR